MFPLRLFWFSSFFLGFVSSVCRYVRANLNRCIRTSSRTARNTGWTTASNYSRYVSGEDNLSYLFVDFWCVRVHDVCKPVDGYLASPSKHRCGPQLLARRTVVVPRKQTYAKKKKKQNKRETKEQEENQKENLVRVPITRRHLVFYAACATNSNKRPRVVTLGK